MVNLVDLIETEDTSVTNPGGYFGPEVNPFGVVIDNRDDETHTPETDAEYEKRKKRKKKQLDPNTGATNQDTQQESVTESKALDKILDDPEVQALLTHLLKKSISSNVTKGDMGDFYENVISTLASILTEEKGTIGPISKEDEKKLDAFPKEEVKKGIKVEKEHTSNTEVAKNVVDDHLKENPHYYELLKKYVEKDKAS